MALKSQEVGRPNAVDITITHAEATAWYNYGDDRYPGSYVMLTFTPDAHHEGLKPWTDPYSSGKLENTCPAQSADAPIPWKKLDLTSESSNDSMRGPFLWSALNDPWENGHLVSSSNFGIFFASLDKAGYPDERTAYLDIKDCRAINLVDLLVGVRARIVNVKQPERKNQKKQGEHYLIDTFSGFADGNASTSTVFPVEEFSKLFNVLYAASEKPVEFTTGSISAAAVNNLSAFTNAEDPEKLIDMVNREDFDPSQWFVVDNKAAHAG